MIRRPFIVILALCLIVTAAGVTMLRAQGAVTAEAIIEANLRADMSVEAELVGQIRAGTRYPVLGRGEFFPWFLLGDPVSGQPIGWVFSDLVNVQGSVNSVPFSTQVVSAASPPPAPSPDAQIVPTPTLASQPAVPSDLVPPEATPSPPPTFPAEAVTATLRGEINIRYGPGIEYARLGVGRAGEVYEIVGWHTQLPWVRIRYPSSPNGEAWVAADLINVSGDLYSLPSSSQLSFNLPTLTPTPPVAQQSGLFGEPVPLSAEFVALGDQIWNMMLDASFDPQTSRLGGFFLMDLESGEAVSYGDDIAFSGTSVNKIAILLSYFSRENQPLDDAEAFTVAEAMICSENISTNEMLAQIGDGNPYSGANRVTDTLNALGLERSFIFTPFANDPFITPQAPLTRNTSANQTAAQPDPFNQMTVSETGALLNGLYQCAANNTGILIDNLPGQFTQRECQTMIEVMSGNRIGTLIEVGVPLGVPVAHKHGWINDTHGDAALVLSPGGPYIFIMMLHNPTWLNFSDSEPLITESSRMVYNYFNPDNPMPEVRVDDGIGDVAACNASLLGSDIINVLTSSG